ncbi:MAG: 3-oxoacyl-[acyl-carrier-protein] synthase III C-terminal domain-containing protein [Candidatus Sericytochromatia bacterium]
MTTRVGITKTAYHLPPGRMTAEELSARTGMPVEAIHEELGMREKRIGAPGESALDHALKAGQAIMEGLDPASIDMLIYTSGSLPDHLLAWEVYKLHETLGLQHARLLEVREGCIGSLHALEAAKNYMLADPSLNRVLVIAAEGYHFSETFADYGNPANEPMYFFADGAAAALLETDRTAVLQNALGPFRYMVDSSHHADVPIPAGGAKRFTSAETVALGEHGLQLPVKDPGHLRRFGIRYIQNYLAVIKQVMAAHGGEQPAFLISNQLKAPLLRILLSKLGLTIDQTVYTMPEWGHVGVADILLGVHEATREGRLRPGSTAVIVSSGVSFSWGACALEILA